MLFWKFFAVVDVLINVAYWQAIQTGKHQLEWSDIVFIPVGLMGTVAVISYAFSLPFAPQVLWSALLPVFVAATAWEIASIISEEELQAGRIVGIVLVMLIAGFTSVAIYRLSGATWLSVLRL